MVSIMIPNMSDPVATVQGGAGRWHRLGCVWRTLRRDGLIGSLGALASEWWFDFRRGTDTWWPASGGTPGDGVPYQGAPPGVFMALISEIPAEVRAGTFVDLGCGKGRPLVMAAEAGFRRLMGVDLDAQLVRVCRRNVKRIRLRCGWPSVEVEVGDATRFQFPRGQCAVFLYNPFRGETFRRVAANLSEHDALEGNEVWVVYVNPVELAVLERSGFAVVHEVSSSGRVVGAVLRSVRHQLGGSRTR